MRGAGEDLYVLLRRAATELERLEAARLGRTRARLRPAHVAVLGALLDASPLTAGELCARGEVEPSTMTGLLRELESRGLIERERRVKDERTRAIRLTPRGHGAARVAVRTRASAQALVLRALGREQSGQLSLLLGQLAAALRLARSEEVGAGESAPAGRKA